ncbi:MAG: polysaccharide biosynthesis C-terminal domain-containing protein [Evtepia sp.]
MEPIPSRRSLCRTILSVSIPISLGSIVIAIGRIIDTATITRGIAAAYANGIPGQPGLPTPEALNQEAVRLAGMLSKSDTILNLPLALNIALATVLVPTLSGALAAGRRREAEKQGRLLPPAFRPAGLPCAAGLISLAGPIYHLLYPNAPQGASLLAIGAVAMIFMALEQTINGSLQGLGLVFVPAQALLCGIGVKLALNLTLIRLPQVNIYGASFGSLGCYATACTICLVRLLKALPMDLAPRRYFWKPLACAVLMGIAAHWGHAALTHLIGSSRWALLITIPLAAVLYVLFVLASGILTKAEVAQLPLIGRKKRSASP